MSREIEMSGDKGIGYLHASSKDFQQMLSHLLGKADQIQSVGDRISRIEIHALQLLENSYETKCSFRVENDRHLSILCLGSFIRQYEILQHENAQVKYAPQIGGP
jgi:hypothetical protein